MPLDDQQLGITGVHAKGDVYVPSKNGAIRYFHVEDIDETLDMAKELGKTNLYPKKLNAVYGFAVAEIQIVKVTG